mmetsp:Transcript_10090/g.22752  ORF Transcript_10090/g.22752 Transcript_10090/m.22752 type:complete len:149 (+) Transcript_10090:3-449(+)
MLAPLLTPKERTTPKDRDKPRSPATLGLTQSHITVWTPQGTRRNRENLHEGGHGNWPNTPTIPEGDSTELTIPDQIAEEDGLSRRTSVASRDEEECMKRRSVVETTDTVAEEQEEPERSLAVAETQLQPAHDVPCCIALLTALRRLAR